MNEAKFFMSGLTMERLVVSKFGIRPLLQSLCIAAGILLVLLAASPLHAQGATGTILGSVKDSTGALVTAGTITLTNTDRNAIERTLSISASGDFIAPLLPIGNTR